MTRDFAALQKHTLHLYEGDFDRLKDRYPEVGASVVIRKLVHKHLEAVSPEPDVSKIKVDI